MSNPPAFQLYAADFYMDTISWTSEQVGCYFRLLMTEWVNGPLPFDAKKLTKVCQISSKKWFNIWNVIGTKFVLNGDGHLINVRLEKTRERQLKFIESQKESGLRGAEKKKELGIYPFDKASDPSNSNQATLEGSLEKPIKGRLNKNQALLSSSSSSINKEVENAIEETSKSIAKIIPRKTFNPFQFNNKNKDKHPGARLHTLQRILKEAAGGVLERVTWKYAKNILDSEHQNYNERDAMQQAEKYKQELAKFVRELERKSKT